MAFRVVIPQPPVTRGKRHPVVLALLAALLVCVLVGASVFAFYYHKYGVIVDERLQRPLFVNTAQIYAAPQQVRVGQALSAAAVVQQLRAAGYSNTDAAHPSAMGTYAANADSVTIRPGPQSFHAPQAATLTFANGRVSEITGDSGQQLAGYALEPLLITDLSDEHRAKRQLVTYDELPKNLIDAVTSIEDRRFFSHDGVDYIRLAGAARADLFHHGYHGSTEGGSTLTMQLARGFFLTPAKHIKRKVLEILITWHLEHHFNKQQIFQMYANEIPLGQAGSFAINGFGEASQVYFGKDVSKLTLPECALLAGIIQSPSRLNPLHRPARAIERRDLVLDAMVETGDITKEQAEEAKTVPLKLAPQSAQQDRAPYFVDLVRDQINSELGDTSWNQQGLRIYTSLDPALQRAAAQAVDAGMQKVDKIIERRHAKELAEGMTITYPQVALVALDPHTGQVLALVGGRNYGTSQFDHAVSHRPTGSIFKPFVYAAAFNSSLAGTQLAGSSSTPPAVFSPVMMLPNQQQTFEFNGQAYTPRNFEGEYSDQITAENALKRSMNNATIALAQMVGFANVAALARDAGITSAQATPAMAIGSYDATPLEMAGAYTALANYGTVIKPWMLASIRTSSGSPLKDFSPRTHPVLDPRVAFLTTSMMEAVLQGNGTGAGVRGMGFYAPAAGKTGTSHDAWFAGYTTNLLCIVWVGNDDYSNINMQGATAAGPIWAEFMKRAVALPQYSDTHEFTVPEGVSVVQLDKNTNLLADATCPDDYTAAFLQGTQPVQTCDAAANDQKNVFQQLFGGGQSQAVQGAAPNVPQPAGTPPAPPASGQSAPAPTPAQSAPPLPPAKKPGFWGRLFGHGSSKPQPDAPQQQPQP